MTRRGHAKFQLARNGLCGACGALYPPKREGTIRHYSWCPTRGLMNLAKNRTPGLTHRYNAKETWRDTLKADDYIDEDLCMDSGWISPEGVFYGCEWMGHISLAGRILPDENNAEAILEERHWIKITERKVTNAGNLTQSQRDVLWDWCQQHGLAERYQEIVDKGYLLFPGGRS